MAKSVIRDNVVVSSTASGTYTTAEWKEGTTACTWTAPESGIYLMFVWFQLADTSMTNRTAYRQLQVRTNGTSLMGTNVYYYDTTNNDSQFVGRMVVAPMRLAKGHTVWPYVHTALADVVFTINICGVRIA